MGKAIEELMHEHQAILSALEVLQTMQRQLAAGENVDLADISALLGFLREFADTCHHGKEEDLLFPALIGAGLAEHEGPIAVMLADHAKGREWIRAMQAASASRLNPAEFAAAAEGYVSLLHAHIAKENEFLFPMTEKLLTPSQLDALADAFEAHETRVVGPGRHEELHALLKGLIAKYAKA